MTNILSKEPNFVRYYLERVKRQTCVWFVHNKFYKRGHKPLIMTQNPKEFFFLKKSYGI